VVKALSSCSHITPILRSLHWLKINERIEYKLLSLTYKVLTTSQPDYLHSLISVQSTCRTRSSSAVTLARPSVSSSLPHYNTNRSFRSSFFFVCITLPVESAPFFIPSIFIRSLSSWVTSSCSYQSPQHSHHLRSHHLSITPSAFHSRLKTHLFHKSFLP